MDVTVVVGFCAASAAMTALICYYARRLGQATSLIDRPDGALKVHAKETPLIGGLAMLVPAFLASYAFFAAVLSFDMVPFMATALIAASVTLVLGTIDDRIGLSPTLRFVALTCIVFAVLTIEPLFILRALRFGIRQYDFGISLGFFAAPFTALVVVGLVNATNMADGMNGQLLGSVLIWSLFIVVYLGTDVGMPFLAIICSAAVTLAFNLRGRLFSGSAGAYTVSLFIALGTIAVYRRSGAFSAVEPILWFWLPVLDCLRLMTARVLAGRSPFFGDRHHIHHILQEYFHPRGVLVIYLLLLAGPGAAAMVTSDRLTGCVVLLLYVAVYAALLAIRGRRQASEKSALPDLSLPPVAPRPVTAARVGH